MESMVERTLSGAPSLVRKVPSFCLALLGSRHVSGENLDRVAVWPEPEKVPGKGAQHQVGTDGCSVTPASSLRHQLMPGGAALAEPYPKGRSVCRVSMEAN